MTVSPVSGHEFWIDPQDFTVAMEKEISADIRIGQDFKGDAFPYIPSRFAAFQRHDREGASNVDGATGDLPALELSPRAEGLTLITYVSVAERIRFQDWEKFTEYLDYEGLATIPARHDARGLPRDEIRELYTRCAKALVTVGDASGDRDRATGMRLELVAGRTPQALSPGANMSFTLLWEGAPLKDTQVALFRRGEDGDDATRIVTRTDEEGKVSFTLPGNGAYLASAVHMIEAPADRNADWESYWASLTFGVE
ncbi:MAG: DUF4198 domain-containing protein [Hoeflea sp.]|uniref:DUF4198 domain-containing protein n=1 Tax=Hoeflea sp. TaxID=1940281 RepID=UPI001DE0FF78|nr:DUF4198 domain-containing protein [Hoeflea sp.]MBU4528424.1 DUF4198 domain-containing protein [Alphaproteobacteria bacterium]MBU4543093.1 DUF4198 domain-containing protein [Alphaproteobacteria bacterium]MBU4551784.1 DUF4198 domain-containing protein [Alphaproteobacteria bacterium]MBV1723679.1 DUF4198 domain-containing protein [Hoeflea sp.]MBV1761995.1 DUF4198 domain-containing protein [Hoeflea sp.]